MSRNVNQKLRQVDLRLAAIDRRLGFLEGQVYFTPQGTTTSATVDIFTFQDQGVTPKSVATGEELSAHRFSVQVSRDWLEAHQGQYGRWEVQRSPTSERVSCEKESESFQDTDTYATITLRVSEQISYD